MPKEPPEGFPEWALSDLDAIRQAASDREITDVEFFAQISSFIDRWHGIEGND
jgi:hypothetical protein